MHIKAISRGVVLSLSMGIAALSYAADLNLNCRCTQMGNTHENLNCKCSETGDHAKSGSIGQAISDSAITTTIKTKLLADSQTSGLHISVETIKGVVNLTGTAASATEKQAAERIARESKGVRDVKNNITVETAGG